MGIQWPVLGQTHMLPLNTQKTFPLENASCLCSKHTNETEQLTHGKHCCVGLRDLMRILRMLCNQVVTGLHDVLTLWVLRVICPSLNV